MSTPSRDLPSHDLPGHDFPVVSTKDIHIGRIMALRADEVVMPGGRVAVREVLEHPGAVAVAALDADDRLMMIHQYRHPVRRRLWELPAGLLDVAGEDPARTARRELAEEAGLSAAEWSVLLDVVTSPGLSDESVRVYLARGVTEVARPDLGDDEEADLVTRWVPLPAAVRMVLEGVIVNAVTVAAVLAAHALTVQPQPAQPQPAQPQPAHPRLGAPPAARPVGARWQDRPTRFAARAR